MARCVECGKKFYRQLWSNRTRCWGCVEKRNREAVRRLRAREEAIRGGYAKESWGSGGGG